MTDSSKRKTRLTPQEVEDAFRQAEKELGTEWNLTGRGHGPRATMQARYSSAAARGASQALAHVSFTHRRLTRVFPYEIVARAAELLKVEPRDILSAVMTSKNTSTGGGVTVSVSTVPADMTQLQRSPRQRKT